MTQRKRRTGEVDREQVNHELRDLQGREVLLPPDLVAGGRHEVVVVLHAGPPRGVSIRIAMSTTHPRETHHQDMDKEVEGDDDPRDRRASVKLGVAEDGRGGVVEDVQELQRLLLDDEEASVEELPVCNVSH